MSSQSNSFIFGSNKLTNFVFNWIGLPIKSLIQKNRLISSTTTTTNQNQITTTTTTENYHENNNNQIYHEEEANITAQIPTQTELSPPTEQVAPPPIEYELPTAFMPRFPSLSRPSSSSSSTLESNNLAPSTSSLVSLNFAPIRPPGRRTLYLGPGHSVNSSSRLGNARRKRLGASKYSGTPGSHYDIPSSLLPNSHQEDPIVLDQPPIELDPSPIPPEEQPQKRPRLTAHHPSDLSSSSQTQPEFQPPALPKIPSPAPPQASLAPPKASLAPPKVNYPIARTNKNLNVTPVRPSPLRNVVLPSSASSPPSQRASNPAPKITLSSRSPNKRNHQESSSYLNSILQEVRFELSELIPTPSPSPIKVANVINPYAQFQIKPLENLVFCSFKDVADVNQELQDPDNRKRKVQAWSENDTTHQPADSQDDQSSNRSTVEGAAEGSLPQDWSKFFNVFEPLEHEETRNNTGAGGVKKKKKTAHVGQLPERLVRKQKRNELAKKSSAQNFHGRSSKQLGLFSSNKNPAAPFSEKPAPVSSNNNGFDDIRASHLGLFSSIKNPVAPFSERPAPISSVNNHDILSQKIPSKASFSKIESNRSNNTNRSSSWLTDKNYDRVPSLFGGPKVKSKGHFEISLVDETETETEPIPAANEKDCNDSSNPAVSSVLNSIIPTKKTLPSFHDQASIRAFVHSFPNVLECMEPRNQGKEAAAEDAVEDAAEDTIEEEEEATEIQQGEEESERIMNSVQELEEHELEEHFELVDHSHHPVEPSSSSSSPVKSSIQSNNLVDLEFKSVQDVVLGLNSNQLNAFAFE